MNEKTDHDILIRVETKLESLTDEVRNGNNGVKEQLSSLWSLKSDKKEFDELAKIVEEHSKDLKNYGKLIYIGFGIVITLQFVLMIIKH